MNTVNLRAYAKINLALDVTGRRENGYHDVRMVMQTISLYDQLELTLTEKPGIHIITNIPHLPTGEDNIIYKAAKLFFKEIDYQKGVIVKLDKRIPIAAGMAGGSTDAAATLIGLNSLLCERRTRDIRNSDSTSFSVAALQKLGTLVGADVPYCILGGTALAEGIGEILTPLKAAPRITCLVVKPSVSVSTKQVYKDLVLDDKTKHPDVDGMVKAIQASDFQGICENLGNVLEDVTVKQHPEIIEIKQAMLDQGASGALMSGSGPTVFGLFRDRKVAEKAHYSFKVGAYGRQTYLTELCDVK